MGVYCMLCNKQFATNYSMNRHLELKDPREEDEEEYSDNPSDDDDDAMSVEDGTDDGLEDEDGLSSSDEDEELKVFSSMISSTYEHHDLEKDRLISQYEENGASHARAVHQAHIELLPKYRKTLRKKLAALLTEMQSIRKHPIYKAVMQKAMDLMETEDYDREEAIAAAVSFRKHRVNMMIPSDVEESSDDDDN